MTYYKPCVSRFIPVENDWVSDIKLKQIRGNRAQLNYYGRDRWFWILPDGTITTVSIEPVGKYLRTLDGFRPSHNHIGFTISGSFPIFRVDQTGEWVWLDYDGRFYHRYVNFVERCDDWIRMQKRRFGRVSKRTLKKPNTYHVKIKTVRVANLPAYRWSVWKDDKELINEMTFLREDDDSGESGIRKIANNWIARQKAADRRTARYLAGERAPKRIRKPRAPKAPPSQAMLDLVKLSLDYEPTKA